MASDIPVHREICQDAGIYFPRFSPEGLAERVLQIQESPEFAAKLSRAGSRRARDFSWDKHVERLVIMAQQLARLAGSDGK